MTRTFIGGSNMRAYQGLVADKRVETEKGRILTSAALIAVSAGVNFPRSARGTTER
jgi:hypothetical protein